MATLKFEFDTKQIPLSRIVDAFAYKYDYQATIPNPEDPEQTISNPETKAAFARRMIKNHIIQVVKEGEYVNTENTIRASVEGAVITPISLE